MNQQEFLHHIKNTVIQRDTADTPIVHRLGQRFVGGWLFDFRNAVLEPEWLNAYADIFWEKYKNRYPFQVGSIETAGIALVAAIVMKGKERGTPVNGFFIRKSRKKDGMMKLIEGTLNEHPIILVDDLINTGSSTLKQIMALADAGRLVEEVFVLVAFRDMDAYAPITRHGTRLSWLYTLSDFGLSLATAEDPQYDPRTVAWKFASPRPSLHHVTEKSAPFLHDGVLYVGSDDGVLRAIDAQTGESIWAFSSGKDAAAKGIFSSPTVHDGRVYFGSYDGNVYSLDAKTGSIVWTYHRAEWVGSSPCVSREHNLVYIGLEFADRNMCGALVALKADSGEEVWFSPFREFVHASPHYIASLGLVVCGDNSGEVRAFDAATGTEKWKLQTGGPVKASFAHDPKRGLILFGSFDEHLYAVNAWSGHIVSSFKTAEPIFSTPLVQNGTAFVASLDKRIYAVETESGTEKWHFDTGGRIFASPLLALGSLWIGSNDSCLYEIDPNTGTVRSVQRFPERIVNAIVVDEHTQRLYVPTVANEIYCLEKKTDTQ